MLNYHMFTTGTLNYLFYPYFQLSLSAFSRLSFFTSCLARFLDSCRLSPPFSSLLRFLLLPWWTLSIILLTAAWFPRRMCLSWLRCCFSKLRMFQVRRSSLSPSWCPFSTKSSPLSPIPRNRRMLLKCMTIKQTMGLGCA